MTKVAYDKMEAGKVSSSLGFPGDLQNLGLQSNVEMPLALV
jgi:hypothetical protein